MKKNIVIVFLLCLVPAFFPACVTIDTMSQRTSPEKATDGRPEPYGLEKLSDAVPVPPQRDIEFVVQIMKANRPVCFSPDGHFVVTTDFAKKDLQLWQVSTGRLVRTFSPDRSFIERVIYDPQGEYLMVINLANDIRLVQIKTGRTVGLLDAQRSGAGVVYAGFTQDGRHALIKRNPRIDSFKFNPEQNSPRLFALADGAEVRNYMITDMTEFGHCVLTADGSRFLAELGLTNVELKRPFRLEWFDAKTGKSLGRLSPKDKYHYPDSHFVISPDSRYLVTDYSTVKEGEFHHFLQFVDLVSGEVRQLSVADFTESIHFSPDSRYVFYKPLHDSVYMVETATGKLVHQFEKRSDNDAFAVSPTGTLVALGSMNKPNSFVLLDYGLMKERRIVRGISIPLDYWYRPKTVFLPGGKAAASPFIISSLLNLTTGEVDELDSTRFRPFEFSSDGERVLVSEGEQDVSIYETSDFEPNLSLRKWPEGTVISELGRRSGFLETLSHNGRVALWNNWGRMAAQGQHIDSMRHTVPIFFHLERAGEPVEMIDIPDRQWLKKANIALSPDGRRAAAAFTDNSGDNNDDIINIWDTTSGRRIIQLQYPRGVFSFGSLSFDCLAFSPDGRYLVVGLTEMNMKQKGGIWVFGGDYTQFLYKHRVDIWNLERSQKVRTINDLGAPTTSLAFSPDGAFLFIGAANGLVTRWGFSSGRLDRSYFTPSSVGAISISPDGSHMLVHGFALSYWEVDSGRHLYSHIQKHDPEDPGRQHYLTWTPGGYYRGSDTLAREYCHLVHGMKTYALDQFFEQFYNPVMIEARVKGLDSDTIDIARVLINSPPPTVSISKPAVDKDGRAEVVVSAVDNGGGVRLIRFFHNGKRIDDGTIEPVKQVTLTGGGEGVRDRGLAVVAVHEASDQVQSSKPIPSGDLQETFEVRLLSGENRLTAIAFSGEMVGSEPETVFLTYAGGDGHLPHLHIVAVGIHQYRDPITKLPMAQRDAEGFVQKLTQTAPALFGNYKIDGLYNTHATREEILNALAAVAERAKPEDMVVFFFAGHGTVLDHDGRFYLVAHGVRDLKQAVGPNTVVEAGVSDLALGSALQKIPALKQVVFLDACQSGGADFAESFHNSGRETAIKRMGRSAGTWVFSASSKMESAYEFSELGHGLFTYSLLAGLDGKAESTRKAPYITLSDLEAFVTREVTEQARQLGVRQKPTIQRGQNDFRFYRLP